MGRRAKALSDPHRKPYPSEIHNVDVHVGQRIRLRRKFLGFSQTKLGDALGVAFQQMQKYERGTNRVSASMLYGISKVFNVPVSYFYDGLPDISNTSVVSSETQPTDLFNDPEIVRMLTAYFRISDPELRKSLLNLIRSLGSSDLREI